MPAGAVNVPALFMPKSPTSRAPSALVVTEGAVTAVPLALLTPPLDVSIGFVRSTPVYAMIPPLALSDALNVHW
jgi:hypothetical protein